MPQATETSNHLKQIEPGSALVRSSSLSARGSLVLDFKKKKKQKKLDHAVALEVGFRFLCTQARRF